VFQVVKPNTHAWEGVLPEHQSSEFPLPEGKAYPSSEARFLNLRMTPGIAESIHNGAVASLREMNAALEEDRRKVIAERDTAEAPIKSSGTANDAKVAGPQPTAGESVPDDLPELEPIEPIASSSSTSRSGMIWPNALDVPPFIPLVLRCMWPRLHIVWFMLSSVSVLQESCCFLLKPTA
jgi:hypothetical protein